VVALAKLNLLAYDLSSRADWNLNAGVFRLGLVHSNLLAYHMSSRADWNLNTGVCVCACACACVVCRRKLWGGGRDVRRVQRHEQ
jgi:hypothetical protein